MVQASGCSFLIFSSSRLSTSQKPAHSTEGCPFRPFRCRLPMPPTPTWKIRNLLFLLVCARAGSESEATPAVKMAPLLRNVRRVMGETGREGDVVFIVVAGYDVPRGVGHKQKPKPLPRLENGGYAWARNFAVCEAGWNS